MQFFIKLKIQKTKIHTTEYTNYKTKQKKLMQSLLKLNLIHKRFQRDVWKNSVVIWITAENLKLMKIHR